MTQYKIDHDMSQRIGARIRKARLSRNMTMEDLGDAISLSTNQVGKYEFGVHVIAATRLYDIARATEKNITFFFAEEEPTAVKGLGLDKLLNREELHLLSLLSNNLGNIKLDGDLTAIANYLRVTANQCTDIEQKIREHHIKYTRRKLCSLEEAEENNNE